MAKHLVSVDKDLRDIVPGYIERRLREIPELHAFHSAGDLESIRKIGHKLAGSGDGYGLARISELGAQMETLSRAGDAAGVAARLAELSDYVENLEIVYE